MYDYIGRIHCWEGKISELYDQMLGKRLARDKGLSHMMEDLGDLEDLTVPRKMDYVALSPLVVNTLICKPLLNYL